MFTKFKTGHKKNTKNLDSEEDDALFSKKRMPKAWVCLSEILIYIN